MFDEPVEPNLLPKEVYSRYDALRAIGQAGMGIVYEAIDRETGAKVALKILKPDLAEPAETAARLKTELLQPLWTPTPTATNIRESRMYTFTPDGLAYSLQLSAAGR